ncbi:asparagine synthase (glutamine-hydrolyzing) [Elongatibacter sediminis]|uniref:asparagine synthase (glutamine-hydrolyzing) n=1 Tax=Elongatibacter sediminis TaxID=3119006 RepID=A0AAW9RGV5_9GAMM
MCGFAGELRLAGLEGDENERRDVLRAMGRQLARRGPDDEQFHDDGYLSLVFRRLSVIDVEGGRQPLWNEERNLLVTVNGEIYNHADIRSRLRDRHRFASQSDAEAAVHLFEERGEAMLDELNGMFALLVWDTRRRRLLLARDRLGIKPLFYARVGDRLLFASELKALLAHPDCPREFDWRDVEGSDSMSCSNPTYIRGVEGLPGGHCLVMGEGECAEPRCWWRIEEHFPGPGDVARRSSDWIDTYGELLHDSVHRHLMSDVPVGLFLSGGIDSTLLAALAADGGRDLHCFTVVEDSTLDAGDVEQAERAARHLGFAYHPVRYDPAGLLDRLDFNLGAFEYLVWALERPAFNLEWLFKHELHRYVRTRVPELKVVLLGQGADEFAGGYSQSMGREEQTWRMYLQRLRPLHRDLRRMDAGIPTWMGQALDDRYPPPADEAPSEFHRQMAFRTAFLQRYNLWHEDRTSSAQGIEARVPFLDHRLVELLAAVPGEQHAELFFDKAIIREQLARAAPFYPRDKLKVRFFETGRGRSIPDLRRNIVRRVYPDFREKYLCGDKTVFSAERLDLHFRHITGNPQATDQDVRDLLQSMAIAMFMRMCASLPETGPPPGLNPPSPLQAWSG